MNRGYWRDLGERVVTTYGVSFAGLLAAHGANLLSVSAVRSAALAAIPAGLSVMLGLLGAKAGAPGTASLLPAAKTGVGTGAGE